MLFFGLKRFIFKIISNANNRRSTFSWGLGDTGSRGPSSRPSTFNAAQPHAPYVNGVRYPSGLPETPLVGSKSIQRCVKHIERARGKFNIDNTYVYYLSTFALL